MNLPSLRRAATPGRSRIGRPALVAAAQSGDPGRNKSGERLRRLHQDWQLRALTVYDTVGECWSPSQFYARALAKTRFFPAILNARGEPEEQEAGELVSLFDRIHDPGSPGRSELASAYGRLQFLTGDGYLTVSEDEEPGEAWEYLSVAELRIDPGTREGEPQRYRRLRAPGATPEELSEAADSEFAELAGNDVRVSRLWRPHPAHSRLADAPIRSVLDLYELLHRLTLAAGAEASSRAANRGMLYIAQELASSMVAPSAELADDPESHPFMRALAEGLSTAIQNPGSAEAMSPFVTIGPAAVPGPNGALIPLKDLIGWFAMGPSDRYTEGEMWEKTIARIGNGLDLPREFLTGVANVNHWGGWLLEEQAYRQYISPVTERFCSDLASAYLRPAARDAGVQDWERVVVGYDPAEAILHPDRSTVSKDAHDRLVISDAAYREDAGYGDEDAPDEAELERRTKILLKEDPYAPSQPQGETAPQDGGTGADTTQAPPAPGGQNGAKTNGNQPAVTASALQVQKILGLAEGQVERARELAGSRLVRRSQSCESCKEKIALVPAALIASALGQEQVLEVIDGHTSEQALVSGVGAVLATKLRSWGINGDWPEQLGTLVEQHAVRTLYDEVVAPLPPGFAAAVAKAIR